MSEIDKKEIGKAFKKALDQEANQVIAARPPENGQMYTYKGGHYSEGIAGGWGVRNREASIFSEDASVSRRKVDHHGVTDTVIESTVTLPTEAGSATYEAKEDTVEEQLRFTASVVRRDQDGNEVYRFKSKNPDFVDKIGAVAAKRIVNSLEDDSTQKAA